MRRTTTVASASAAVLCLGVLLTGCGSAADTGHAAVGAAGPADGRVPNHAVPPKNGVELTPLDGDGDRGRHSSGRDGSVGGSGSDSGSGRESGRPGAGAATGSGKGNAADGVRTSGRPGASGARPGSSASPAGAHPGHGGGTTPPSSPGSPDAPSHPGDPSPPHGSPAPEPPSPTLPSGPDTPDGLLIGTPGRFGTDVRWCERVTLDFLNTGDRPVTAGTVTFGTHIIGALGIDWATVTSTHKLPLPLAPGRKKAGSWRVCVDGWRVPAGMHIDTKDVTFTWK
ncbi:hypothetical protein [Streptomyces sp. NPDC048637]|uniref:hypothetical protein n=1 Tax=Streptomyces sp. NPDC048637 TaxID=3155636 RepID=UPI00341E046D